MVEICFGLERKKMSPAHAPSGYIDAYRVDGPTNRTKFYTPRRAYRICEYRSVHTTHEEHYPYIEKRCGFGLVARQFKF